MTSDLKPCPFCGDTDIAFVSTGRSGEMVFGAMCCHEGCSARGPAALQGEAITAWNTRDDALAGRSDGERVEAVARIIDGPAFNSVIQWMDREYLTEAQAIREVERWEYARNSAFTKAAAIDALYAERIAALEARAQAAEGERDRMREALTPSEATKAAYMGEFRFRFGEYTPNVPWITIKEIMSAILARAELDVNRDLNRDPMATWQGACGHLWDRCVENTDQCPRCAAVARAQAAVALVAEAGEALGREITMQDVRLAVGEGPLKPADVLAGANAELSRRRSVYHKITERWE